MFECGGGGREVWLLAHVGSNWGTTLSTLHALLKKYTVVILRGKRALRFVRKHPVVVAVRFCSRLQQVTQS